MKKIIGHIRVLFLLVMLPAYFLVLHNSVSNRHCHVMPNGVIITHAHPMSQSDTPAHPTHKHSKAELFYFGTFSKVLSSIVGVISLGAVVLILLELIETPLKAIAGRAILRTRNGRAPPVVIA
ncbi:hypothetical protein EYV94_17045 [Puteibacter caeruleilacunae]|nr:hypothetical protein EYV94_17045 [Puteibacter caeruleilacunae]